MQTSENINELATALWQKHRVRWAARPKLLTIHSFKSKYADLGSVIAAAKDPLAENGLSYVQFPLLMKAMLA
jgi:hypothetical protein